MKGPTIVFDKKEYLVGTGLFAVQCRDKLEKTFGELAASGGINIGGEYEMTDPNVRR